MTNLFKIKYNTTTKNWIYHNFSTCYIIILFMQTHAFAKDFSHFHLWAVKRLQKAAQANSPHLRQFANRALSSLILTIQQTTQPFNGHVDPNFQQLNSTCILRKRLQQTALTPLHTRTLCKRMESRRIHGLLTAPWIWNYFGRCSLWLCCVKGEARRGSRPEQTRCAPRRRDQEWEARGSQTSERTNGSRDGNGATQRWQHSQGTIKRGAGRGGPLPPSKENSSCLLPLSSSKFEKAALSSQGTIC